MAIVEEAKRTESVEDLFLQFKGSLLSSNCDKGVLVEFNKLHNAYITECGNIKKVTKNIAECLQRLQNLK